MGVPVESAEAGRRLPRLLRWLGDECGYTCFWQGGGAARELEGRVRRRGGEHGGASGGASGGAAPPARSLVEAAKLAGCGWGVPKEQLPLAHGNLVCAHAPPVVERLRSLC